MRFLPWLGCVILAIAISLAFASTAEARHFWQTYGSTVPAADGCTWNWNSDYFVPRHCSSCRYGLYSPCKTSCMTSPACKWSHPFYPGYCSPYGPCHYRRRNHVYAHRCGCEPIAACLKRGCHGKACRCIGTCAAAFASTVPGCCLGTACTLLGGCGASGESCGASCESGVASHSHAVLHNVEPIGLHSLGSIPVDSSQLLSHVDLNQLGADGGQLLLQPESPATGLPAIPSQNINSPQLPQPE